MAIRSDHECFAGERVVITYAHAEEETSVSGWTIATYVTARLPVTGGEQVTALVAVAGSITDAAAGTFTSTLTATHTRTTLGAGVWDYQTWRTDAGGETTLAYGELKIKASISAG
jgi:hypothetical protein